MKLAAILLFVGVALLGYAFSISPYKNEALFEEKGYPLSSSFTTIH